MPTDSTQRAKIIERLAHLSPDELRERLADIVLENRALKRQKAQPAAATSPDPQPEALTLYKANLLDQVSEAVISTDTNFNILSWNRAAEQIYGWRADEVVGKPMRLFLPTEYVADTTTEEAKADLMEHGYWMGEVIHPHKGGQRLNILNSTRLLYDDDGALSGVVGVNLDITLIRQTQLDLQHHEMLLQQITENMGEALWVRDAHTHALIYKNAVYFKLWNIPPNARDDVEVIFARIHPDDRAIVRQRMKQYREGNDLPPIVQYRIAVNDDDPDEIRWVESRSFYIRDNEGNIIRYGAKLIDITEHKRAQQQLHDYERRLQLIVSNLPVMLYTVSANRIITFMDGKGLDVLGMAPGQFVGMSIDELGEQMPDAMAAFNRAFDGRGPMSAISQVGDFQLMTYYVPYVDAQGNFSGVIGLSQDVTHHQNAHTNLKAALDRQSELHDIRARFVAVTSHEFRTPLTTVQSSLDILQMIDEANSDDGASARQRHYRQIATGLSTLQQLMDDVLMYSEAEVGAWTFKPRPVNALELCEQIAGELQRGLGDSQQLRFGSRGSCPEANIDPLLFRKMVINLLDNAIKYSPDGGEVQFVAHCDEVCLELTIKDQGIGIPTDEIPKLFQAFHRAQNVGTLPGTGLGLSVVKEVVELHDGVITVHSQLGQGTEIIVTLPSTVDAVD